jgi:hypothetical protein
VAIYCQDPAKFGAQIGDWLKKYYEEAQEDQDRVVAEAWKRIHAGDETVTTMRTLYALRTTSGRLAIIALAPGADPWLAAVRYVRDYLACDEYLAGVHTSSRPVWSMALGESDARRPSVWWYNEGE